jgi:hypothetical protein
MPGQDAPGLLLMGLDVEAGRAVVGGAQDALCEAGAVQALVRDCCVWGSVQLSQAALPLL